MAVYRLRHPLFGAYLYAISPTERDAAQWQYGYLYEGTCCYWQLVQSPSDGSTPLFRLYSGAVGEYLYTASVEGRDAAVAQYGYLYEGVVAYCRPQGGPEAPAPWHRLRLGNRHIYTIYTDERDAAVSQYGYTYEGIACYLPSP